MPPLETSARLNLSPGDRDHSLGPKDAPVSLVEYGNYECPYCYRVYPIVKELQHRLGDNLHYVYRHLPLRNVHPHSRLAAEAAEAAAAQGKFWEMHEHLYEHREALEEEDLIRYAEELDLDVERFKQDLADGVHEDKVQEDFLSGVRSGANGTPTFFVNGVRYDGPWDEESLLEAVQKPLGVRVRLLAQVFTRLEASGGIILLICTILALLLANSPWAESYFHFWEMELALELGDLTLSEHLLEWVNDGLMVIFFFVVGLEIKREVTTGELAEPKRAALPVAAALGGMVVPAAIYFFFNAGGSGTPGWGIPMATDIAFTLGILTVLGRRVPLSLKVFFTALAIADDLGAVLVIALFYTADISWISLGVAAIFLLGLIALNRSRVYATVPYAVLGIGLWLAFLTSGVHPTIAGVLLALTIPTRSPANTRGLLTQATAVLEEFELPPEWRSELNSRRQATVQTLEEITSRMQSPARRLEHELLPWSTYLILPIFAFANAGVALTAEAGANLLHPVSLGIVLGLVLGKPLGITLFSWVAVKFGLADLPTGTQWTQLFGASCLAGIGFTMSLFIANAAFDTPELLDVSKLAILVASLMASLIGWGTLSLTSPSYSRATQMGTAPAAGQ